MSSNTLSNGKANGTPLSPLVLDADAALIEGNDPMSYLVHADERTGNCGRNDGPRDHRLRKRHDIHSKDCAQERHREQVDQHHRWSVSTGGEPSTSAIGTERAAGTSCAVTFTPVSISERICASSCGARKTYLSFCTRPAR